WACRSHPVGATLPSSLGRLAERRDFSRFDYALLVLFGLVCQWRGISRASAAPLRTQQQTRWLIRLQNLREPWREVRVELLDTGDEQGGDERIVLGLAHLEGDCAVEGHHVGGDLVEQLAQAVAVVGVEHRHGDAAAA